MKTVSNSVCKAKITFCKSQLTLSDSEALTRGSPCRKRCSACPEPFPLALSAKLWVPDDPAFLIWLGSIYDHRRRRSNPL